MANSTDIVDTLIANDLVNNPLPTRAEKRFVSKPVLFSSSIDSSTFNITAAMKAYTDFVMVKIPGRGRDAQGNYLPNQPAIYRFLINPSEVSVAHQTMNAQSFSRGGWQFGVAGDAPINITLSGKTPGRYFYSGLADNLAPYSLSFRSLEALEIVIENNGYWFEGEQVNEGPLAATSYNASAHRLIKMHQDVELHVGDFIWVGMFDDFSIQESADTPHLASFNMSFIAWKERFKNNLLYLDSIHNDKERGHYPKIVQTASTKATEKVTSTINYNPPPEEGVPFIEPDDDPINDAIQNPGTGVLFP